MAQLQEAGRIKRDREQPEDETQNELTHTQRRAIVTVRSMEKRDRSGVKGQDYFSCNKHFSTLCNSEAGAGGR